MKQIFARLKMPKEEVVNELIRTCMEFISEGSEKFRSHPDVDCVNQISRALIVLSDFLQDFESRSDGRLELLVQNHIQNTLPKGFALNIPPNMNLKNLKMLISNRLNPSIPSSDLLIFLNSKALHSKNDNKPVAELGIVSGSSLNIFEANYDFDNAEDFNSEKLSSLQSIFSCFSEEILILALESVGHNLDEAINLLINEDSVSELSKRLENNRFFPKPNQKFSEILSNSQHYFDILFSLFEINDETISSQL